MYLLSLEELKEEGIEIGDEGKAVREIEESIDLHYAIKRLPIQEQKIVKLKLAGYNQKEISDRLSVPYSTIKRKMSLLRKKYAIIV